MRPALLREVVMVALDSLRANKMRSALTILGVVIGITAIVGMTALIRGFDESLRDSIRELGPNTIFVAKFSGVSLAAGNEFAELLRRPEPHSRGRDGNREACAFGWHRRHLAWRRRAADADARVLRRRTHQAAGGARRDGELREHQFPGAARAGRFFTEGEVSRRRNVVVLGQTPYQALFGAVGAGSGRQAGADRRGRVHGGRRGRQAAVSGRLRPRPGRLRRHPGNDLPQAVRHPDLQAAATCTHQSVLIAVAPRSDTVSGRRCWRKSKRSCASGTA